MATFSYWFGYWDPATHLSLSGWISFFVALGDAWHHILVSVSILCSGPSDDATNAQLFTDSDSDSTLISFSRSSSRIKTVVFVIYNS